MRGRRTPVRGRPVALLLLLGLVAPPCGAESKLEPPDTSRYLRWGPLRARPRLQLTNVGYDDNIFLTSENTIGDYTATLGGNLEGLLLFGDAAFLTFDALIGYTGYLERTDQNFWSQFGNGRLTVPLRRFGVFTDARIERTVERPIDQDDIRPDRDVDDIGAGVIVELGWRTELELRFGVEEWRYFDPDERLTQTGQTIGERLNRTEYGSTLTASYLWRGRTRVTLAADRETIEFDAPTSTGASKDAEQWNLTPGMSFGEGGPLTGTFRFGWGEIDAVDPALPDFSDFVGEAALAYRPVPRTTLRLSGRRLPGFAVAEGTAYFLDTSADLSVVRFLTRVFGVEAGAGLGRLTFPEADSVREDDLRRYQLGLRVRLAGDSRGRSIEYSLTLRHFDRDSTVPTAVKSNTTFGLGAKIGF